MLRGINVGGKNKILKDELAQAFTDLGFSNVRTYIQSGNILFRSESRDIAGITQRIEKQLSSRFNYEAYAVVYSMEEFNSIVEKVPPNWGTEEETRYSFIFTLDTITPEEVVNQLKTPDENIETVSIGKRVIYWAVPKKTQNKSVFLQLPKYSSYKRVTIRNITTVNRLNELFKEI